MATTLEDVSPLFQLDKQTSPLGFVPVLIIVVFILAFNYLLDSNLSKHRVYIVI